MKKLIAALLAAGLAAGLAADADAATKKKKPKPGISEAQKKELRKKYAPICAKQYAQGGDGLITKVEVKPDGSVYCWYRI